LVGQLPAGWLCAGDDPCRVVERTFVVFDKVLATVDVRTTLAVVMVVLTSDPDVTVTGQVVMVV